MKKIIVLIVLTIMLSVAVFAQINTNLPWHYLSQVATDSGGGTSVDDNGDGIIDNAYDADRLDGQHGAYYLDDTDTTCNGGSCNIANTGTLDGVEGANFLRSNSADTFTGTLTGGANTDLRLGDGSICVDNTGSSSPSCAGASDGYIYADVFYDNGGFVVDGDITAVNSGEGTKGGSSDGAATIEFDCSEVAGDGLLCSGEDLLFDCSDVAGSGLSCSGENLILSSSFDSCSDCSGTFVDEGQTDVTFGDYSSSPDVKIYANHLGNNHPDLIFSTGSTRNWFWSMDSTEPDTGYASAMRLLKYDGTGDTGWYYALECRFSDAKCKFHQGTFDYAESFPKLEDEDIEKGQVVTTMMHKGNITATSSTTEYDASIVGVRSTNAGYTIGPWGDEKNVEVALAGRAPVIITNLNGIPQMGDSVTTSFLNGYGMKATEPGTVIGKLLQEVDWTVEKCLPAASIKEIEWPDDDLNTEKSCFMIPVSSLEEDMQARLAARGYSDSYLFIGKIMTFINVEYWEPEDHEKQQDYAIKNLQASFEALSEELNMLKHENELLQLELEMESVAEIEVNRE